MSKFPLKGVIGVVANSAAELDMAVANKLHCVEIRADLLLAAGLALNAVIDIIRQAKQQQLACLFTLRHPSHGGKFPGDEQQRVAINRQALDAGADIIDLEWGSEAAEPLLAEHVPLILSQHDFNAMLDETALAELTKRMLAAKPSAIKVVPTATSLADAARMLRWVEEADNDGVPRIGFAMGALGACSRILTLAFGAPITYASFGEPVAPGQIAIDDLLNRYRAMALNRQTRIVAVVGNDEFSATTVASINQQFQTATCNVIGLPFAPESLDELLALKGSMRIDDIRKA